MWAARACESYLIGPACTVATRIRSYVTQLDGISSSMLLVLSAYSVKPRFKVLHLTPGPTRASPHLHQIFFNLRNRESIASLLVYRGAHAIADTLRALNDMYHKEAPRIRITRETIEVQGGERVINPPTP